MRRRLGGAGRTIACRHVAHPDTMCARNDRFTLQAAVPPEAYGWAWLLVGARAEAGDKKRRPGAQKVTVAPKQPAPASRLHDRWDRRCKTTLRVQRAVTAACC